MIVISSSLVLSPAADNPLGTPIFGWHNLVTPGSVAATSEDASFPATNVANPSTALRWQADAPGSPPADEYLTVSIGHVDPIDYLAVAVHNFGSGQIPVSVEGVTQLVGSPPELDWTELVSEQMLASDDPVVFRFTPQSLLAIRLRMQPGIETPTAAVLYVGKLLVAERGTHQDYTPINQARMTEVMDGRSESGHFLGRVVLSEKRQSPFALRYLRDAWYRTEFDPFLKMAQTTPFFFAHKPLEFPGDVGYVTLTNDPQPVRHFDTGTRAVELQMVGVAVS